MIDKLIISSFVEISAAKQHLLLVLSQGDVKWDQQKTLEWQFKKMIRGIVLIDDECLERGGKDCRRAVILMSGGDIVTLFYHTNRVKFKVISS